MSSLRQEIGDAFPELVELRGADTVASIDMTDRPLRRVLERLAQIGGFEIDTSAVDASRRVSFTVRNTSVGAALASLSRSEGLFYSVLDAAGSMESPRQRLLVGVPRPIGGDIRVGGDIRAPRQIKHVSPEYPQAARDAKLVGRVVLEARIGLDGAVEHVVLLRGIDPLLDESAASAVQQWRYEPVLYNGNPVVALLTVTVRFQLQ